MLISRPFCVGKIWNVRSISAPLLLLAAFALGIFFSGSAVAQQKLVKKKKTVKPAIKVSNSRSKPGVVRIPNTRRSEERFVVGTGAPVTPGDFSGDVRNLSDVVTESERARYRLARPKKQRKKLDIIKKDISGGKSEPEEPMVPAAPMPTPSLSYAGMEFNANGAGFPPDTDGDVGYSYYIQAVNTSFRITNKTGTTLATSTFAALWAGAGTGTPCDTAHNGDPTVIFDPATSRWVIADFSWTNLQNGPYYECIAVSKTTNPVAGGWWLYAVRGDDAAHPWLPDYPKMGIWRDGLYMGVNMFDCLDPSCGSASYKGVRVYALNFAKMINGTALNANDVQVADLGTSRFTVIPANYRGTLPPVSTPAYFVGESQSVFAFEVYKFNVNFTTPASTTFTGPTNVSQTAYALADDTVAIPAPGAPIDTLADRMMKQVQYRNISGVESLWVNHTTGTTTSASPVGIQWAQINVTGGTVTTTPVQQQIYNNGADGIGRFMGSLAVDKQGNMALGYTAANSSTAPDIRYAGRLAGDALGTLPQTETTMLPGLTRAVQTAGAGNRWGDYSSMSVDPMDDCTFWYTQEWYAANGLNWQTRIGTFKFPGCVGPTASFASIDGRVLTTSGDPIRGARVSIADSEGNVRTALTSAFGYFSIGSLAAGRTYTVTASAKRFTFTSQVISLTDPISDLQIMAN